MIKVPSELVDYFGKSNAPIFWLVPQVLKGNDHLGHLLQDLSDRLETTHLFYDGDTPTWVSQLTGLNRAEHKREVTIQVIGDAVAAERLRLLGGKYTKGKVKPYDNPDLDGILPDSDGLVELDDFCYDGRFFPGLNRKQTVFEVLPSLAKAVNSMYWTLGELTKIAKKAKIKVRLDPLLVHDVSNYAPVFFRMLVWGKPLDWNAIAKLKQADHSRWFPDPGWQEDVEFTDMVWTPRDDGIQFTCEEVPKLGARQFRGSRYSHGIYTPNRHTFIHCDGAIRIYDREELLLRHQAHVRQIGKIGKRIKTFMVEGEISTDEWTNLTCSYFVWNNDLQNYFGTGIKRSV